MRDAAQLEEMGLPTVTISLPLFESVARNYAGTLGFEGIPLVVIPSNEPVDYEEALIDEAVSWLVGDIPT